MDLEPRIDASALSAVERLNLRVRTRSATADGAIVEHTRLAPGVDLWLLDSYEPLTVTASRSDLADEPEEIRLVSSVGQSAVRLDQGEAQVELTSGAALLYPNDRPFTWQGQAQAGRTVGLSIDRSLLRSEAGVDAPLHRLFRQPGSALRVMNAVMLETIATAEELSPAEDAIIAEVLLDLTVGLVRAEVSDRDPVVTGRLALLRLMLDTVRRRIDDPDLGPAMLAQTHFVSRRYVHSLFGDLGVTPAAYIRRQRLQLARQRLADPSAFRVTMTDIAWQVGFRDQSSFSRSFRREYGVSPSDFRNDCLRSQVADRPGHLRGLPPTR